MLDIIGYLKIDESKPERVDYLIASLRSFEFLKKWCSVYIHLSGASRKLYQRVESTFLDCKFSGGIQRIDSHNYGKYYCYLLDNSAASNPFILNFMEDQFCLCDDIEIFSILSEMKFHNIDVCRAAFHQIELKSITNVDFYETRYGYIYANNFENFTAYQKFYGSRYYVGCNFITTRDFALKFWGQDVKSNRPHEYEIKEYRKDFEHTIMIPKKEIICSIDDDHGEEGTCLLKRNEPKFKTIYEDNIRLHSI